jgi:ribonuclease PH
MTLQQATVRIDGRAPGDPRPVKVTPDYLLTAEGSCLIETGNTRVLCAASVEETVPGFGGILHAAARDGHADSTGNH